jgi:hypothetical protein
MSTYEIETDINEDVIMPTSDADAHEASDIHKPGHFALPNPDHAEASGAPGASLTEWDAADESHAENHDDFPMIVWLRGDEPWFQQFDMDAESVMGALGIKRSRLTQIAGKELRVGRVRVDRYVRPVFRRADVERYISWTRATASHQKSSDAIKIAVDQLSRQSDLIQKTVDDVSLRFTEEIRGDLRGFISNAVADGITPIEQRVMAIETALNSRIHGLEEAFAKASNELTLSAQSAAASIQDFARGQAAALEALTLQMHQTSEKTAIMEERLTIWDQMLSSHLKLIANDLKGLKQPLPFKVKRTKKPGRASTVTEPKASSSPKPLLQRRHAPSRRKPAQ